MDCYGVRRGFIRFATYLKKCKGGGALPSHAGVWSRKKALSGDGFPSEYSVMVSLFCHEQIGSKHDPFDGSVLQATQDYYFLLKKKINVAVSLNTHSDTHHQMFFAF